MVPLPMDRRTLLASAAALPAAGVVAAALPASAAVVRGARLATGLTIPWGLDFLPDRSALVTERDSARVLRVTGGGTQAVVGSVPGVQHGGEGGLLGLAVSPTYASDRRVYVYYTTARDNRVAWTTYAGGRLGSTFTPIVTGIPRGTIHNGGGLLFTRAGMLFIGCGETGDKSLAQNLSSLGGKILRVDRNGRAWPGNPLIGRSGDDRICTWGHRNPQGIAQNTDGAIWSAELGQDRWDELNRISLGRNYGWPRSEGTDGPGGYTDPLAQWNPDDCSPSGVACTKGKAWVGALNGESLWSVDLTGRARGRRVRYYKGVFGRVRTVKLAPDGSLWITTANGGGRDVVQRIFV